jgi:hypothetical protein
MKDQSFDIDMLRIHVPGSSVEKVAKRAPEALLAGKPSFTALEADATLLVRIRITVQGFTVHDAPSTKHQAQARAQAPGT